MSIRMEKSQQNALLIARWLKEQKQVKKVYYPGLPEHPGHEIMKKQCKGYGCPEGFRFFNLSIDLIFLLFRKFRIECNDTLFPELERFGMPCIICIGVGKIIYTFFDAIEYFPFFIFHINIVIFEEHPCFFHFRKCLYGFGENISITGFECMKDVAQAVEPFIGHLDGPAGYMAALLQAVDDVAYHS